MEKIDIKEFRRANKMTQQDLANYLGVTQSFVCNMEAGRDTIPDKYIRKILNDPNVDTSMFLLGNDSVKMTREVFEKMSKLIDTVCSQQQTIADQLHTINDQHRTIDTLLEKNQPADAHEAGDAGCADAK